MKLFDRLATLAIISASCLWIAACGSGSSGSSTSPPPSVTPSISVAPSSAVIGAQQQFTATASNFGTASTAVTWSVSAPSGSSLSAGDISSTGLYNTPYPAPPSVTVTATSTALPAVNGSVTVTLSPPAATTGPTLAVDVNTPNNPSENPHTISPYIYGMNAYLLDSASEKIANPGILRWGGDDSSRYNYQNGWTNSGSDWYFENGEGAAYMFPNATGGSILSSSNPTAGTNFTSFFPAADAAGSAALGTMPLQGWVSNGTYACSFPSSTFPNQVGQLGFTGFITYNAFISYNNEQCGYGVYPDGDDGCTISVGCNIYGNDTVAQVTSIAAPPPSIASAPTPGSSIGTMSAWANGTWPGGWVKSIASNPSYGNGSSGKGVAVWDLDNEPTWWDGEHRDVHPDPFSYDEVTNNGIGTALAIKTADPTALVSGPVIDYWWAYYYSKKDIVSGWQTGNPCFEPWSNPIDREAHNGVPLIEYYLQQFNNYSQQYGVRLLDYLDVHGYFAPDYPPGSGVSTGFNPAGDTQEQEVRANGTRAFWDPTYTDPDYPQPNYITDTNYTTNCSPPPQAPNVIPMLQTWVNRDYPGTLTAIDEYNFGGLESISGAVVEADILGIFGRQGLGLAALWPLGTPTSVIDSTAQNPANYAFAMYRNYDGKDSLFGDTYLYATSTAFGADAEGQLAVYGAQRSSDNAITVMVINKTYGSLTSTLSLENFTATSGTTAQVYQYSSANLNAIATQTPATVTPAAGGSTSSTISYTFPGQSITLLVIPQ
jgi:hypothetical protein